MSRFYDIRLSGFVAGTIVTEGGEGMESRGILGIAGSPRCGSYNRGLMRAAQGLAGMRPRSGYRNAKSAHRHYFCDVAVTESEAKVKPHRVADDL